VTLTARTFVVDQRSSLYPQGLRLAMSGRAPEALVSMGELGVLQGKPVALFCSVRCPGRLILQTYDLTQALRAAGVTVISGFHSPMEKECLNLLLRGSQPVIVCPARGIEEMRVPSAWRPSLDGGRLLVVSPFPKGPARVDARLAARRNEVVAALAEEVFISYAAPGGGMETLARWVLGSGKPVLTFEAEENRSLIALGATPVTQERWWPRGG